ncbi:MAG: transaldolase family protein [Candidatus Woykebacteria bacterium]
MKKGDLKSKIFVDGGDPDETREAKKLLGFVDGQTTNPTLISKNPDVQKRLDSGKKFTEKEAYKFYREVVEELAKITEGPISIEVYADHSTPYEKMLAQGREMFTWIPNAYVKFPTTKEGLKAASTVVKEGLRVNMTLCFSQEQAAAVYAATLGTKEPAFVSPFVGRFDDRGENGMGLIENILKMYEKGDGHVLALTASVRNVAHLLYAIKLGSPLITAPFKVIKDWSEKGLTLPDENFGYNPKGLKPIPYKEIPLDKTWTEYNIQHDLTDTGIKRFSEDWNQLVQN